MVGAAAVGPVASFLRCQRAVKHSKRISERDRGEEDLINSRSDDSATQHRLVPLALTGILLLALVLRIWGIGFGLPYVYHFDEHFYVNTALNLGAGVINNPPYAATGLSNILFGEYAAYYVVGNVLGEFASPQGLEAAYRGDPTLFYLLGRLTTALFGVATVLVLYWLGRMVSGTASGLLAAGFLSISFLHVRDAHFAVPDIVMPALVIVALALAVSGLRTKKRRHIYLAALAGGLAVATKWTGLPVVLVVLLASIFVEQEQLRAGRLLIKTVLFTVLLLAAGFALGSPQILYNPAPYVREALNQMGAGQEGGFEIWQVDTLPGWLFYIKTLLYGVGAVLVTLGCAGAIRRTIMALRDRDPTSVLLLLFPATYYLVMGTTRHYFARYALPLIPFVALFAAEILVVILAAIGAERRKLLVGLAVVLILSAIVQPLAYCIRHDLLLSREDTRTIAKRWIEANLPEGASIALDWQVHGPPLSTEETPMPDSDSVYEVTLVGGSGLADRPLAWYREQGFDYLIASSFLYSIPVVDEGRNAGRRAFYNSLEQELQLVKAFHPGQDDKEPSFIFDEIYGPLISLWQRERPGPTIKIYGLQH